MHTERKTLNDLVNTKIYLSLPQLVRLTCVGYYKQQIPKLPLYYSVYFYHAFSTFLTIAYSIVYQFHTFFHSNSNLIVVEADENFYKIESCSCTLQPLLS